MRKGFTLIELVAVFAVMLILITIGTISLSKTLSTNNKKTVQLKSGNILRTLEDYILENKINLPETRPLYFSVSSLIKQDILNTDANQVIAKTLNKTETNNFYVEVSKNGNNLEYNFVTSNSLSSKIQINNNALAIQWFEYKTTDYINTTNINQINVAEKTTNKVKFVLKNTTGLVYNTYIEKLSYEILDANNHVEKAWTTANDLTMNKDGSYAFTIKGGLEAGIYHINIRVQTDLSKLSNENTDSILNNSSSPLTINVIPAHKDPVECLVTIPTACDDKWYNDSACNISVTGKSEKDNTDATDISYTIKRYVSNDGESNYQTPDETGTLTLTNGQGVLDGSTFDDDGYYKIKFVCENDTSPKYVSTESNMVVRMDKTGPTFVVIGNPTSWQKTSAQLTVNVTEDSISQLPTLAYSYDTDPSASDNSGTDWTSDKTKSYATNGIYTVSVRDNAGNISKNNVNITYIDVTGPTIPTWSVSTSAGNYVSNTWTANDVTWTGFAATDSQSGVDHYEYSTGCTGNNWANLASSYTYPTGTNITWDNSYCVRAVDKVGNISNTSSTLVIKVDQEAPTMTKFDLKQVVSGNCTGTLANNTWTNDNVCILPVSYGTITASDNHSGFNRLQISSDNINFYNMMTVWDSTNSWNYITAQGTHYRYIRAVDNVGNVSASLGRTIKIDKTAPSVVATKVSTTASGTNCTPAIYWLKMTTSDNLSKTKLTGSYRYSNSDWGTIGGGYTYTFSCNTTSADNRVYMDMNPSSYRVSDSYYIKMQGYLGSEKTRLSLKAVDEAGNTTTITEPSSSTWFE